MHIRWSKDRIVEQHLEGACQDINKLVLEFRTFEGAEERPLRVHSVRAHGGGEMIIVLDISKEG